MNFDELLQNATQVNLKDLKIGDRFEINLIKSVKTKFGPSFIIYSKNKNYSFFSNSQLKGYLNKVVESLDKKNSYYFKSEDLEKFLEIQIKDISTTDGRTKVDLNFIKNNIKSVDKCIEENTDRINKILKIVE